MAPSPIVVRLLVLDLAWGGTDGVVLHRSDLAHDGTVHSIRYPADSQMYGDQCDRENVKREDGDALVVCVLRATALDS
jgi:hypothetical protein